jgi:hypothetical protein
LRLFAVACCRRIWPRLNHSDSRAAVEVAEQYADKLAREQNRKEAATAAKAAADLHNPGMGEHFNLLMAATATEVSLSRRENFADSTASFAASGVKGRGSSEHKAERRAQAALVHDVFGNPFRPVTLAPAFRTPPIVSLARAGYDERQLPSGELDTHRLAVLADALEEAGAPGELVSHLRGPGPHVRGCHVVDLCLGKE